MEDLFEERIGVAGLLALARYVNDRDWEGTLAIIFCGVIPLGLLGGILFTSAMENHHSRPVTFSPFQRLLR